MTQGDFQTNLREAIRSTLETTRRFVSDELPDKARLLIVPNCSYDGNSLKDDEEIFPGEEVPQWTTLPAKNEAEAAAFLYRKGKVPEWINVKVDFVDSQYSYLILECCGRFTGMEKHLYHRGGGIPPFSPQVATPKLDYDIETDGQFPLHQRYNS